MSVSVDRPARERLQAFGELEQLVQVETREQAPNLAEPVARRKLPWIALEDGVELAEAPSGRDGIRACRVLVDPAPEGDREPVLVVGPRIDLVRRRRDRRAFRGQELRYTRR